METKGSVSSIYPWSYLLPTVVLNPLASHYESLLTPQAQTWKLQILLYGTFPGITQNGMVILEMILQWTKFIPKEILSHLPDLVKKMKEVNLYCRIIWGNF